MAQIVKDKTVQSIPARNPPFPSPGADYIRFQRPLDLPGMVYRFRRTFELAGQPASACLRITGFTEYAVWVNDRLAGRGPLPAGQYCATYDVFDVAPSLQPGRNVIAVQLMVGLYDQMHLDPAAWIGGGLIADFLVDGRPVLVSDAGWKCELDRAYGFRRPRRNVWRPFFEEFDARRDEPAWRAADFDDSTWPACRFGNPKPTLREYEEHPGANYEFETDERFRFASAGVIRWLREPEEYYWLPDPAAYHPVADRLEGVTVGAAFSSVTLQAQPDRASFFRVVAQDYVLGRPFFELEADADLTLDMVWSERKTNDDPLLTPQARMANWTRYITRQGQQYFLFFDLHGYKELQITLQPGQGRVTVRRLGAERQWSMRCRNGALDASDERYGKLWRAGASTVACITTGHHSDNSFREQAPWSGDQEWTKMGAYVSEGVHPITRRQFRHLLKGQSRDGRLRSPYPHAFPFNAMLYSQRQDTTGDYLPCHALGYILSLARYHLYADDQPLIEEAWPALERQIRQFETAMDEDGLLDLKRLTEAWIWVDWRGLKDRSAPMNALWAGALGTMSRFAELLGHDPTGYRQLRQRAREAFIRRFWDPSRNLFVDLPLHRPELGENLSQLTQAIAACFDLLPESCDRTRLAADLTALDGRLGIATPPMQGFVFSSLEKLGADALIHAILQRQWFYPEMLDQGTLPEFWPNSGQTFQSFCQGGGPMISWALTYYVLGIRPVSPGFRRFVVQPAPGSLEVARGLCPTPHGPIRVEWRRQADGRLDIKVDAPAACEREE